MPGNSLIVDFFALNLDTPALNLALDEALLEHAEAAGGGEFLRIWESQTYCAVLGKNCSASEDVWIDHCAADGVPLLRRVSGGGTVLLGPGCLNYSLILPFDRAASLREVPASFDYILARVAEALGGPPRAIRRAGPSDLAVGDRKFCGNAQRRQRTHLLHHGSILHQFDIERVERYLKLPRRQPDYRRGRRHGDFLANLYADPASLAAAIRRVWSATHNRSDWPVHSTSQRAARHHDAAWVFRVP